MLEAVIKLTEELITYPSITPEDAGCQTVLKKRLAALGFNIVDIPCENAANFWAQWGTGAPLFVFAGHTDVVPVGLEHQWHTPPFQPTIKDGYLYGRGAADMKGSLAAMLIACENFLKTTPHPQGSIGFLITSAEEGPSDLGTPQVLNYLAHHNISIDHCIVGEPTSERYLGDTLKIGRRGSLTGELIIKGEQGHIAYPHKANNPLPMAFSVLQELGRTQWDGGNDYFAPTHFEISNMHAGTGAGNVIPGEVTILFNLRFSPERTAEDLKNQIEAILVSHTMDFTLNWTLYANPFLTQPGILSNTCQQVIQNLAQIDPLLSTSGGTSDARYISTAQPTAQIVELGPCNATIHQVNECIALDELVRLTHIYQAILTQLL